MALKSLLFAGSPRLQRASNNAPALKRGDPDVDAVRRLQVALVKLGFALPISFRSGTPDGIFGQETYGAIVTFQKKTFPHDQSEWDGSAGRNTLGKMDVVLAADADYGPLLATLQELPVFLPSDVGLLRPNPDSCLGNPGANATFYSMQRMALAKQVGPVLAQYNTVPASGPTVICNGNGGYTVELFGKDVLPIGPCLRAHEESHIRDLREVCPDGCKGKKYGTPHPQAAPECPAFKDLVTFFTWRKPSEIKAYTVERDCLQTLKNKQTDDIKKGMIKARLKQVEASIRYWEKFDPVKAVKG